MNCACHGESMLWRRDSRYTAGGYWGCRVKNREGCARRRDDDETRARYIAQQRRRYDADPVYRIEKRLTDDRRARGKTLTRRRERLGQIPL